LNPPLHPVRLEHPLEGGLRRAWERYVAERPGFDILCGPEVHFLDLPTGVEADENNVTGGYQPYPYGRMTARDHMVAAETIQWLGSPLGFAFLSKAFEAAGGRVMFDDYAHRSPVCRVCGIVDDPLDDGLCGWCMCDRRNTERRAAKAAVEK